MIIYKIFYFLFFFFLHCKKNIPFPKQKIKKRNKRPIHTNVVLVHNLIFSQCSGVYTLETNMSKYQYQTF